MGGPTVVPAARGSSAARQLRVSPVNPLPERLVVGGGTAIFLDGLCSSGEGQIGGLEVLVDDVAHPVLGSGMPPPGAFEGSDYWWAIVPFEPIERARLARLRVRARPGEGSEAVADLGVIELVPRLETPPLESPPRSAASPGDAADALIAICMATYEPPIDLFERQIESLRAQTYPNWVCVISDDATSEERLEEMRAVLGDDERFSLSRSPERLGFYGNFERALSLAPPEASLVSMCDQDDRWYPDKLATLQANLRPESKLVYSDMRIVDGEGRTVFDTYWTYRRNNHENFGSLMLANTITGAASLFRREVLDYGLPFPPRYGVAYHDHWVAVVAMALGEVDYVDRPLYDYVQHDGAVLGHARANGHEWRVGPASPRARARLRGARGARALLGRLRVPRGLRYFYFTHYCGTALTARVVEARCGHLMTPEKLRVVRRFGHPERAFAWLAARSPRRIAGRTETLRREDALMGGIAWRYFAEGRRLMRAARAWGTRQHTVGPAKRAADAAHENGGVGAANPEQLVDGLAAAPNPNGTLSAVPHGASQPWLTPILVDYFTRDGSTLMMRLLASSPQVAVEEAYPYERKYFNYLWRWARMLERGQWPSESWNPSALASITQESHKHLLGPPPWHPRTLIDADPGEESMSRRCFDLVWVEFSRRAARAATGQDGAGAVRYYAEKHLDTWVLNLAELPPVELIVLLRDPRDTYVSITAFNRMRGDAGFGRARARDDREHLDQLIARQHERLRWIAGLLDRDDHPVVRYEELVLETEAVARRLERRLGIELDPEEALADSDLRRVHVSSRSPEASVGRWRRELDPEAAEIINRELGPEISAVGYEL